MPHDAINNWVENAKKAQKASPIEKAAGVQVITRVTPQNRGGLIMEISEKIRPWLMTMLDGMRDNDGMLLQPAHVRAIALDVAQGIVKKYEN